MRDDAKWKIIYDGRCRFCTGGASKLARWLPQEQVELVDYNLPDALSRFPTITREACDKAMHLVDPSGRVYRGAEAAVRAVAARGPFWRFAMVYYIPGFRWLMDRLYARIAANRYSIAGRNDPCEACGGGACRRPDALRH